MALFRGPFSARRDGAVAVRLKRPEALHLLSLVTELVALLKEEAPTGPVDPLEELTGMSLRERERPADPVLARLLPDGYGGPDGPGELAGQAAEFRRFSEGDLRAGKTGAALAVAADLQALAAGADIVLGADRAEQWLATLNDIRLALGTLLEIDADPHRFDDVGPDDPRMPLLVSYDFSTALLAALLGAAGEPGPPAR